MTSAAPRRFLALRLALRDARGGIKGLRIFVACLVLGVAAMAGVGSLTFAIREGLSREGQSLLGGDVEATLSQRAASAEEMAYLADSGTVSAVRYIRSMVRDVRSDERRLAEVKAVDDAYPLYGNVGLSPMMPVTAALRLRDGAWGAALAPELVAHLQARLGDRLRLGGIELELRAVLTGEPDGAVDGFELAPRLLIHADALDASGLLSKGALVRHSYRVKLAPTYTPKAWRTEAEARFPDAGWRLRDRDNGAPQVREFADRVGQFLLLVGLTTLIVGGVGVAGAVRAYLGRRVDTIATLKALGAQSGFIRRLYLLEIIILAIPCVAVGLVLGASAPWLAHWAAADRLPAPLALAVYPLPLLKAGVAGLLIAIAFTLLPVETARLVPAARLYRRHVADDGARSRRLGPLAIAFGIVVVAVSPFLATEEPRLVAWFFAASVALFLLLFIAGVAIEVAARRLPRLANPAIRLGVANLCRPGAPTRSTVVALGLGLTLFAALALIEANLEHQVSKTLPGRAPAFYFIDIQGDQKEPFVAAAAALDGVEDIHPVPYVRGQIIALNGNPADVMTVAPEARWALRGDRGLTFAADLPAGNRLVAGEWWPRNYEGPPAISFDAELARGMGLGVGDTMTISVLGRPITARIMSLREIDWGTLGINFAIVFDPTTLQGAPYTYLATLSAEPHVEAEVFRRLTDAFPNVSAVRMKEVLEEVRRLVIAMGAAVRLAAAITILAGILVLAGATAAGQRDHIYDAVILKLVGGTRATVFASLLVEYVTLGLTAGVIAAALGTLAAFVVVTEVMAMSWSFFPASLGLTLALSMALTVLLGLLGTGAALAARPAAALRDLAA